MKQRTKQAMRKALGAGGAYMVGAVRAEIRAQGLIDTGFMLASVDHEAIDDLREKIGTNAHYAVYLEYGTRYIGAKAFMRNAIDDGTNQANVRKLAIAALGGV